MREREGWKVSDKGRSRAATKRRSNEGTYTTHRLSLSTHSATKVLDIMYLAYLGLLDVLLSTMLVIYGTKFDRCLTYQKQLLPRSRNTFKLMNLLFVFVFISRAVYAFLNVINCLPDRQSVLDSNARHEPLFYGVFMFYFYTEAMPVLVLVGLIWRVPKKQARSFSGNNQSATSFHRHLQRGSTGQGFMSASEEMSVAGESDTSGSAGHNLPRNIDKARLGGIEEPLLSGSGSQGDMGGTPGSGGGLTSIFENVNRYDSPPTGGGSLLGNSQTESDREKFVVGSNTSSTDPRNNFSNIQASFGSDTISPYDILTNYTNRRQSSVRRQSSGLGVDARPGSIGRTGTGGTVGGRSSGNQNLSTSAPRELGSNASSLRPSSFTVNRSGIPPLPE